MQGRVWSLALTIDGQGEARASDLIEHTAELGGQSQLGNISSFGVDADGELYIVSLSRGAVLSVAGLGAPHADRLARHSLAVSSQLSAVSSRARASGISVAIDVLAVIALS